MYRGDHSPVAVLGVYTQKKIQVNHEIFHGIALKNSAILMISNFCFAARAWVRPYRK